MRWNGCIWAMSFQWKFWHRHSPYNSLTLISLQSVKFWQFVDVLSGFWLLISWKSALFLFPVYLTYWPRKCVTDFTPHDDNFHQIWSWYRPSAANLLLSADTLRDLVILTFWASTVVTHGRSRAQPFQVSRSQTYSFLSYELRHLHDNAFAATMHASDHVTGAWGIKSNYTFGIPIPTYLFTMPLSLTLAATTINTRLHSRFLPLSIFDTLHELLTLDSGHTWQVRVQPHWQCSVRHVTCVWVGGESK